MKQGKIGLFFVTLMIVMGIAMTSFATPVWLVHKARVDAEPATNGSDYVTFTWTYEDPQDMWQTNQVQFCPDPLRDGCDNNAPFTMVKISDKVLQINIPMEVIKAGQSAENLANDSNWLDALWLGLPDCGNLTLGKNLVYYKSVANPDIVKSGGMHILYVGPGAPFIPQAGDSRAYTCGANAPVISAVVEAPEKSAPVATSGKGVTNAGGDNKVSVKGNNNDVTPQKVQQSQKMKTVIKGNNNTVKKTQTQIGVNAKTTGANSPVYIHINGYPSGNDGTCATCHPNATSHTDVKVGTIDSKGNIITKQNTQQKREEIKK
jgi:hypothetical protein